MTDQEFQAKVTEFLSSFPSITVACSAFYRWTRRRIPLLTWYHWNEGKELPPLQNSKECSRQHYAKMFDAVRCASLKAQS